MGRLIFRFVLNEVLEKAIKIIEIIRNIIYDSGHYYQFIFGVPVKSPFR